MPINGCWTRARIPGDVVIAGDSAGGNMALATLLMARDRGLPMPKLAVALSPPTDFEAAAVIEGCRTSLADNEEFDWINRNMLLKWADWYCSPNAIPQSVRLACLRRPAGPCSHLYTGWPRRNSLRQH